MKIGILGGTFDPIHHGHLLVAERAREGLQLDEVWFIPVYKPPHKQLEPIASAIQRMEMVKQAIGGNPYFRLIDTEIRRGGTSYTFDTMQRLHEEYSDAKFFFIIGMDIVKNLPRWHQIEKLVQLVTFVCLARPGFGMDQVDLPPYLTHKVRTIPMPALDISSTDIRQRLRNKASIRYMVSDAVMKLIKENRLYES